MNPSQQALSLSGPLKGHLVTVDSVSKDGIITISFGARVCMATESDLMLINVEVEKGE